MGRAREFDEAAVLTAAMHVFRRQGYAGTSIKELERATSLTSGSIYHSYRDKDGLFQAAFAHYNRTVLARRIADHAPPDAGLAGLRQLFHSLLREPDGGSFGCLITNAAIEFGDGRPDLPAGIRDGLGTLATLFVDRLEAAHAAGRLRPDVVPASAGPGLLALYQGVLVLVRSGWDDTAIRALVDDAFDRLQATPDGPHVPSDRPHATPDGHPALPRSTR